MEFAETLQRQCAELARAFGSANGITLTCTAARAQLSQALATDLAVVALGLIASAADSFTGRRHGRIGVALSVHDTELELTVEHSGPGTQAAWGGTAEAATLEQRLVVRLGGRLECPGVIGGVRVVVTIPGHVPVEQGAAGSRLPPTLANGDPRMDEHRRNGVDPRANELWEAAGRPEGHELVYPLRAALEIGNASVTRDEDPPGVAETGVGETGTRRRSQGADPG